jgi:membrane-associated protease RseP (regulator of RpoE activity)
MILYYKIMLFWLIFFLVGLLTYIILQRNVAPITRTPLWLLWLVVMLPPIVLIIWLFFRGNNPTPVGFIIILFVFSSIISNIIYQGLVNLGKISSETVTNGSEIQEDGAVQNLSPINDTEEKNLKDCFPWSVFYLEKLEHRPQVVLCLGNLRTNPDNAYQTIKSNVERYFGDRFLIIFQESFTGKPFFALVPNPQFQKSGLDRDISSQNWIAIFMLIFTIVTTIIGGVKMAGLTVNQLDNNLTKIGLPYAITLLFILVAYGLSQYIMAKSYNIKITLPYIFPLPPFPFWEWNIGTLGVYLQRRTPIPHRKALFDTAIIGIIVGAIASLLMLGWGLSHSEIVPLTTKSGIFNLSAFDPRFSLLLTLLSKLALGTILKSQTAINLHPVAIAAYIGLVWTVFKLLPVGKLDGGLITHAMFGQRTSIIIGQITWLLLLIRGFIHPQLFILVIFLLFVPLTNEPALNDVSELDNGRDIIGLIMLGLLVLILLPTPESIARLLQI